jgi:hypothetical protein
MLKSNPEISCVAEPLANIPRRRIDAFIVADILADIVRPVASSAGVLVTGNSDGWNDWQGLGSGLTLTNVGFVRFETDGNVSFGPGPGTGAAGFHILPYERPIASYLESDGGGGSDVLLWAPKKGTWKSVSAIKATGAPALYNVGNDAEAEAETTTKIAANQALTFDLRFWGQGIQAGTPIFRLRFGGDLCFTFRQNLPPTLEREVFSENGDPSWNILKVHDKVGRSNLHGGFYNVSIRHIDGKMIWTINGRSVWLLDSDNPDKNGQLAKRDWYWSEAPLNVNIKGARVRVEVGRLSHEGVQASVTRRIPRAVHEEQRNQGTTPIAGGWYKAGTDMPVVVDAGADHVTYTATLTPSEDGIHTPLLRSVMLSYAPAWTEPVLGGVDISRTITSASINLAAPPQQCGADATLEIDRGLMEQVVGGLPVMRDYCPVTVRARWRDDRGVPGSWDTLFQGYFYGGTKASSGFNNKTAKFGLRDELVRMSDPAGKIDHTFKPLGLELLEDIAAASKNSGYDEEGRVIFSRERPKSKPLYSGDCVKVILRNGMGPAFANSLNGNGDPQRFFPASQIPLWSASDAAGSFMVLADAFGENLKAGNLSDPIPFPAPYGDDMVTWIGNLGADDIGADFFISRIDRGPNGKPVPIYGRYLYYLDNAILYTPVDAVGATRHESAGGVFYTTYDLRDLDYLISEASTESRPDKDINRILVWAGFPGAENNPLMPAQRMAEARLVASDPNSDIYSWARTKIFKNNLGAVEGGAEVMAAIAMQQIAGLRKEWPSIKFRGEGNLLVGDVIRPKMDAVGSDSSLGLHGKIFRSSSITHDIIPNASWDTTAQLRPMARIEEVRFRGNQNLPIPSEWR